MKSPGRDGGFTLIEITIVLAILGILASISIPNLLRATVTANMAKAGFSLKTLIAVEANFKSADLDQNGINDYYTRDVAGLYYMTVLGASLGAIPTDMANADGNSAESYPAFHGYPKGGYWYLAQADYQTAVDDPNPTPYGIHSMIKFSFVAAPGSYPASGRKVYCMNEKGEVWQRDPGSESALWTTLPATGATDTDGTLSDGYDTFPYEPYDPTPVPTAAGPWTSVH